MQPRSPSLPLKRRSTHFSTVITVLFPSVHPLSQRFVLAKIVKMVRTFPSFSLWLLPLLFSLSLSSLTSSVNAATTGVSSSKNASTPDIPVADLRELAYQVMKVDFRYSDVSHEAVMKKHATLVQKWGLKREYDELLGKHKRMAKKRLDRKAATATSASIDRASTEGPSSSSSSASKDTAVASKSSSSSASKSTSTGSSTSVVDFPLTLRVSSTGAELETDAKFVLGGKEYLMTVDSGSLIPWLESDAGYPADSSKLTRAVQTDGTDSFLLQYGIGNVSGTLYHDNITLSGTDIKVTNLTIGSANETSSNFVGDEAKGVLGLGFSRLAPTLALSKNPTFMDLLFSENSHLASKEACFALKRTDKNDTYTSVMRLGGADSELTSGSLSSYAVNTTQGYWQFAMSSLSVESAQSGITGQAIIDTATSFIPAGWSGVDAFWGNVVNSAYDPGVGAYTYPCDQNLNVTLAMPDGTVFPIKNEDMNLGRASPGSQRCIGAVLPLQTEGVTVLGLSVLKNLYFCLDHGEGKVRLAKPNF